MKPASNTSYPLYHKYIATLLCISIPALAVLGYAAYQLYFLAPEQERESIALLAFATLFLAVASFLTRVHYLRCPACRHHSMAMQSEPVEVTSLSFVHARVSVSCRHCGCTMASDLALKSNAMVKSIPTRVRRGKA